MNTRHTFFKHPLQRTVATALVAVACGVSLPAFAQPYGPGPGMAHGMAHGMRGGPGMGGMGGMDMMAGPGMERALDAVNASADQKAQIRQILQAARTDLRAQSDGGVKLHEQMRTLLAQPNIDANAAEALRQQMLARHDASSKRMLQAMLDAAKVLTPEQRKALADRMAARRTLMERQRAERRSLDGAPRRP